MANSIIYRQGTKASYLVIQGKSSDTLYYCTDTKELFKGSDLYSDGVRYVASYANLPTFSVAADGILYLCKDNGNGYVMNETRNGWVHVVHGVDNSTVEYNGSGAISVKNIPMSKVTGLTGELSELTGVVTWVEY